MARILQFFTRHRTALITVILAILLSIAAMYFADRNYVVRGVEFTASVRPSPGGHTVLELPPLGRVRAETHRAPVRLVLTLKHVDVVELQGLFAGDEVRDELFADLVAGAKAAGRDYALRLLFIATLLGALAGLVAGKRSRRHVLLGAGTALIFSGALVASTVATFDAKAFSQPQFTGNLRAAPAVVGAVRRSYQTFEDYRSEVRRMAANLSRLYLKMDALGSVEPPSSIENNRRLVTILHLSDIHNNVVAYDFIGRITATFPVDLIVDSGDITDFGTGLETDLLERVEQLDTPYLWVAGNHDSPGVTDTMGKMKAVTVLDGGVTVDGLRFAGYPDPQASRPMMLAADSDKNNEEAEAIRTIFEKKAEPPDILVVHNPALARRVLGKVPIVLTGHTHKAGVEKRRGTWIINAGTTGGAGLRTLQKKEGIPLSLQLLYIDSKTKRLVAIDSIVLQGTRREFTLRRRFVFDPPPRDDEAAKGKDPLFEISAFPSSNAGN